MLLGGLLISTLYYANRRELSIDQCFYNEQCYYSVVTGIKSNIYQANVEKIHLFATNQWVWIWEIYHPNVCMIYYQRPTPLGVESSIDPWDATWVEYWNWRLLDEKTSLNMHHLFFHGGFSIPVDYSAEYSPKNVKINGCSFWMLSIMPQQKISYGKWIGFSSDEIKISRIVWACERWDTPAKFQEQTSFQKIDDFFQANALILQPNDLAERCDWYLWCSEQGECESGGQRFEIKIP